MTTSFDGSGFCFFKGFLKHHKVIESKYIESGNLQKTPEAIQEWNMVQANLRCLVDSFSLPILRTVDDRVFYSNP